MYRRDFLKSVIGATALLRERSLPKKRELITLRASDGFRARVFLDGIEVKYVTEIVAAPEPNIPVQGSVITLITNKKGNLILLSKDRLATRTSTGEVYWLPLE